MSWPWLKSAEIVTGEPIVDDENRPAVADLLQEHRRSIEELKSLVENEALYEPAKHDDIWLLRFILSHKGKVGKSFKAVQHTLQFRKDHQLDEEDIRFQPISRTNPKTAPFLQYVEEGAFNFLVPNPQRGVIAILQFAGMDQHAVLEHVKDEEVETFFITISEWTQQWLDYVTRTTGRLTKSVRIVDPRGITLSHFNRATMQRNAKYVNAMEDCYPQMLQTVFPCHAPALVQGIWQTIRPLLPKRLLEKVDFINPEKRAKDLEKLLKHVDENVLPTRYGGKNEEWPPSIALPDVK